MMKMKYTKKQIIESINHWKNVLKYINESQNNLLKEFSKNFGNTKFLNPDYKTNFNVQFFNVCYSILNEKFFSSRLNIIPIYYLNTLAIKHFLKERNSKYTDKDFPKIMLGVHSVLYDNDVETLKMSDTLQLYDDAIILNIDYIQHKSLIFAIACLCHEMIHYYDRLFGEYCTYSKYAIISKSKINMHNTPTFEDMKDEANNIGINVIQEIPSHENINILDAQAIQLLMKKAKEDGLILEGEDRWNRVIKNDSQLIGFNDNGKGGVINTF